MLQPLATHKSSAQRAFPQLKVAVGAEPPSLPTHLLLVYLTPSHQCCLLDTRRHHLNKDKLPILAQTEATSSHVWKILLLSSSYTYRPSWDASDWERGLALCTKLSLALITCGRGEERKEIFPGGTYAHIRTAVPTGHCFFLLKRLLLAASPAPSTEIPPSVGLTGHPHLSKGFVCCKAGLWFLKSASSCFIYLISFNSHNNPMTCRISYLIE